VVTVETASSSDNFPFGRISFLRTRRKRREKSGENQPRPGNKKCNRKFQLVNFPQPLLLFAAQKSFPLARLHGPRATTDSYMQNHNIPQTDLKSTLARESGRKIALYPIPYA